jgi:cellulose synthase/poly-beta-1,6-N-acetylglucosamine synthase-like glycosyltransferase
MGLALIILYGIALFFIFAYSTLQLSLALVYLRTKKERDTRKRPPFEWEKLPTVTVQLPVYNELYVVERLIEAVSQFEYPRDKFEIQVLDDSTDETVDVVAKKVAEVKARGIDIVHIHRTNRKGFKAGALEEGLAVAKGEFIAIFDADFLPNPNFLLETIPYFESDDIGVVQTRWSHINKKFSLLTELQAFGLNAHFSIEQGGRNAAGHFINFNGTGGVWRKKTIVDAGGWEHDTLTEDLDLSYRAQMKGWRFVYLEHVTAPAELPVAMTALKNQQFRWTKGGAECFRKMSKRLFKTKGLKLSDRIHGLAHLFNSSVFVFILLTALLSLGVLYLKVHTDRYNDILMVGSFFILSTIFLGFYYWTSYRDKTNNLLVSFAKFVIRFLQFLTVSMGMSLHNSIAVIEGYRGIKSSFVRTPKFNIASGNKDWKTNKYVEKKINLVTLLEGMLSLIFFGAVIYGIVNEEYGLVPFHTMLFLGFGLVFLYTIGQLDWMNRDQSEQRLIDKTVL